MATLYARMVSIPIIPFFIIMAIKIILQYYLDRANFYTKPDATFLFMIIRFGMRRREPSKKDSISDGGACIFLYPFRAAMWIQQKFFSTVSRLAAQPATELGGKYGLHQTAQAYFLGSALCQYEYAGAKAERCSILPSGVTS